MPCGILVKYKQHMKVEREQVPFSPSIPKLRGNKVLYEKANQLSNKMWITNAL